MVKLYQTMVRGGQYEMSFEEYGREVYESIEVALEELQLKMVEQGCKQKHLKVMHRGNKDKGIVKEVWNRHKADENNYSEDIPMTGYVIELELVKKSGNMRKTEVEKAIDDYMESKPYVEIVIEEDLMGIDPKILKKIDQDVKEVLGESNSDFTYEELVKKMLTLELMRYIDTAEHFDKLVKEALTEYSYDSVEDIDINDAKLLEYGLEALGKYGVKFNFKNLGMMKLLKNNLA